MLHAYHVFQRLCVLLLLLLPLAAHAATQYYLAPTGADSAPCTESQPCATFASALGRMQGGDTLWVRGGTYAQRINSQEHPIPSGSSWEQATRIAAYPGEVAILKPGSGGGVIAINGKGSTPVYQYISIEGLVIDATGLSEGVYFSGENAHHLRLARCEVKHATHQGIQGNANDAIYEFLTVHHNGSNHLDHGFYICPTRGVVRYNHIYLNSGYGIQLYDSASPGCATGTRIEGNVVHDNCTSGGGCGQVTINHGTDIQVVNNVVYNAAPKNGIEVSYGSPQRVEIAHNTLTGASSAIQILSGVQDTLVRHNILWGNQTPVTDWGVRTTQVDNMTSDPLFVDAGSHDYRLQEASPARDAALALASVPRDRRGVGRPQGLAADLGAYEMVARRPTPPTPTPTPPATAMVCVGEIGQIPGPVTMRCRPQEERR